MCLGLLMHPYPAWPQVTDRNADLLIYSDIEIAMAHTPKRIVDLAVELGLQPDEVESYGKYKAKVELSVLDRLAHRKDGKYIIISGCVSSPFTNHFTRILLIRLIPL